MENKQQTMSSTRHSSNYRVANIKQIIRTEHLRSPFDNSLFIHYIKLQQQMSQ